MSSYVPRIPVPRDKSPYENQTPTAILSRERLVFQKVFTTSETTLMNVISPSLWASNSAVSGAWSTFRYFRFKQIKYRIVLQANPFVFGYFTLTCLPNDDRRHNNALALADHGWFSHDDCLIMDLTSMPEASISVPWLFNNTWIDIEKWNVSGSTVATNVDQLAGLKILYDNTCGSTSSTVPKTFSISVFIQVIEPELCCPISPGATDNGYVAQASFAAFATQAAGAFVGEMAGDYLSKTVWGHAETEVSKFLNITNSSPEDPHVLCSDPDKGTDAESSNVVPSVFGGMNYSASRNVLGTGSMGIPKGFCKHNSLSEFLRKPTLVNRSFFTTGTGATIGVPIFTGNAVFGQTTGSVTTQASRLRFLAQFYRMYRGSITYTFLFIASPMVTFRMKIGLDYQGGTLASVSPGDTLQQIVTIRGTTVHQVTVPYLYTTPWRVMQQASSFVTDDVLPQLTMSEFSSASKSGDTTPFFYFLVYESANNDFIFASQQEPMPQSFDTSSYESQCDIRKFISHDVTQFGAIPDVHFASDSVQTFEAMAKRWSPRVNQSLVPRPLYTAVPWNSDATVSKHSTLDALSSVFYWSRGQFKFKVSYKVDPSTQQSSVGVVKMNSLQPSLTTSTAGGVPAALRFCDGVHAISYGLTQVIEFTVPYLCNVDWVDNLNLSGIDGYVGAQPVQFNPSLWTEGSTQPPLNFVAVSAGRDFCFSYSLPPPYFGARWYDCASHTMSGEVKSLRARSPAQSKVLSLIHI